MLPPDMMAPPAPGGGGGLPPDLMSLLGGGGGAPPGGPPMEEETLPGVTDGAPGGGEDALVQAIDLIQEAIDAESDQEDVQVLLQCQTKLQGILAKNQKDGDAAMGGKISPGAMRKQAGSL